MHHSLEHFLDQVARQGSWFGGGSVAALSAALAAALLEKLLGSASTPLGIRPERAAGESRGSAAPARRLARIRRECFALVSRDAEAFARVIAASRSGNRRAFTRTLKSATEIPCRVFEHAQAIRVASRVAAGSIKPQFQSDLKGARAMAGAAAEGARALIETNLMWLHDHAYTSTIRSRLRAARSTPLRAASRAQSRDAAYQRHVR